ncbi:MAG: SHOCT domain-containing protein [Eubacteriales bacterium]
MPVLLNRIISYMSAVPDYLIMLWKEYPVILIVAGALFIIALFFPGSLAAFIRRIFIVACFLLAVAGGFMGSRQNGHQMICIGASAILIVGIVRLIINLISAAHRNRVNRKIEKVALEKAAKRRGSFKKRQGFNGDRDQEPNLVSPEAVSQDEIRENIEKMIKEGENEEAVSPEADEEARKLSEALQEVSLDNLDDYKISDPIITEAVEELQAAAANSEKSSTKVLPDVNEALTEFSNADDEAVNEAAEPEAEPAPEEIPATPEENMSVPEEITETPEEITGTPEIQPEAAPEIPVQEEVAAPAEEVSAPAEPPKAPEAPAKAPQRRRPYPPIQAVPTGFTAGIPIITPEVVEALDMLAKLRDRGILTEEEFTDKKRDILSRI